MNHGPVLFRQIVMICDKHIKQDWFYHLPQIHDSKISPLLMFNVNHAMVDKANNRGQTCLR